MSSEVNLKSVDAMFATMIAEQKAMRTLIETRSDNQDLELAAIKVQTTLTNGKVIGLLQRERDSKVRTATIATVVSTIAGLVGWLLVNFFSK
jgi:hypothetical protein